jgi:ribosomal protein S18 acetylase RimI-like enzyme
MPDVVIRSAASDDLDRAAQLRGAMAREMGHDWEQLHPGWQPRFAGYWADRQNAGRAQCFFAEHDGALAGMCFASITDEYRSVALDEPRGYINGVYVKPELRRRGIARSLTLASVAWLRERGCVAVRLRASDAGRPLYASLGFKTGVEMELFL